MTILRHEDAEKNFNLFISTIMKMHEVGFKYAQFRIVVGYMHGEPIVTPIGLLENSVVVIHELNRSIIELSEDLLENCNTMKNFLINQGLYETLLNSENFNQSYEVHGKVLGLLLYNTRARDLHRPNPNMFMYDDAIMNKKYDEVLQHIKNHRDKAHHDDVTVFINS